MVGKARVKKVKQAPRPMQFDPKHLNEALMQSGNTIKTLRQELAKKEAENIALQTEIEKLREELKILKLPSTAASKLT